MVPVIGKTGCGPNKRKWAAAPVVQAKATGIKDLGENSNNNNSIARKIAAIGLPKVAAIPEVAPAANKIFRSLDEIRNNCPIVEPNAPPVAIIGPSAQKGPPVPMEMAAEIGFNKVIAGLIRL